MATQLTENMNARNLFLVGKFVMAAMLYASGIFSSTSRAAEAAMPSLRNSPQDTPTTTGTPVEPEWAILEYVVTANPSWTCGPIGGTPGHRTLGCITGAGHSGNGTVDNYGDHDSARVNWQQRRTFAQSYYSLLQDTSLYGYAGYHAEGKVPPYNFFTQEDYYLADVRVMGGKRVDDTNFHYAPDIATAIMNAAGALGYLPPGPSPTPTHTATTITNTPTNTPVIVSTTPSSITPTVTPSVEVSPTVCLIQFTDVSSGNTFYSSIMCLACRGILGGYSDGTFRPGNNTTRGQIAKIVSNSAGFNDDVQGNHTYTDVPPTHTFWLWVERLTLHAVMSGYPCGGQGEPCDNQNRLYFRPGMSATRGQIAKIVSNAAGLGGVPTGQFYADVPVGHTFYEWIMRLTNLGVLSGYPCGSVGEPCDNQNRPYFRPANNVTRGQASKIVANTFFPGCKAP